MTIEKGTGIEDRVRARERIGEGIGVVSVEIADHLLVEHQVAPGSDDYIDLFADHMVDASRKYPEVQVKPEEGIVYNSAKRNRTGSRVQRARVGGRRWSRDVTGF